MVYPQRTEITPDGEIYHDIIDEWVLAHKPPTLLITSDKAQIANDGTDTATLTIQLRTPILIDGSYDDVAESMTVQVSIDDATVNIVLDANGTGTLQLMSVETGTFYVRGFSHDSPVIEIKVV